MKRFLGGIALVGLLLSFAVTAQAQLPMKASIFGGVSLATLSGDDTDDLTNNLGFTGGAQLGFDLHPMFRLAFAAQYVQKGAKLDDPTATAEGKFKLDYIEFRTPLTLKIPLEGSSITPRIYAGGYVGIEMSCKISGGPVGGTQVTEDCADLALDTKSVDFGASFGVGIDFGIGAKGAITFDALYDLGLVNIDDTVGFTGETKNRAFLFLLGYQFSLGG